MTNRDPTPADIDEGLRAFCREIIQSLAFDGGDGGDVVQDLAVKHGLLIETEYDPDKHGPNDVDAEAGEQWYVFSPLLAIPPRA